MSSELGLRFSALPGIFIFTEVRMKNTKVTLASLTADDRERFVLDNQRAFKYGALQAFGERNDHIDGDGEIISRKNH